MDEFLGSLAVAALFNKAAAWLLAIVLVVIAIGFVGMIVGANGVYQEGLERGYVEYCKDTGARRWIGECEGTQ